MNASEVRKVIRIGEKSVGVTLPREWLLQMGVDVGSPVKLTYRENVINVVPLTEEGNGRTSVRIQSDNVEQLLRTIIALYIEGVDEIAVSYANPSDILTRIEQKLPGVVSLEDNGSLKLKIITREDISIEEIIRSLYAMVETMFVLFERLLETGDRGYADEIFKLDEQIDRLYFFSLRVIKKRAYNNPQDYIDSTLVIKNIEHVGDALDRAASTVVNTTMDEACKDTAIQVFRRLRTYALRAISSAIDNKPESLIKLLQRQQIYNEVAQISICASSAWPLVNEVALLLSLISDIAESAYSKHIRSSML